MELTASPGGLEEQTAHFRIYGHVSQDRVGILESLILINTIDRKLHLYHRTQTTKNPKTHKST